MIAEVEILKLFLLVMARFSGLILSAPVIGSNNIPPQVKIGLIGLSAFLVTPTLPGIDTPIPGDALPFALMAAGEMIIGLIIGLVMQIAFAAIQVAGQIMDMQSGFGLINVFNPALGTQVPLFGFFFFILAVLFLLVTNGHHMMIRALVSTFDRIPVGGFSPDTSVFGQVAAWSSLMFYDAILIAAPVMVSMMLAYVAMGLMSRVVPQLHLFVVGFPLTIAISLLVVALSIGFYLSYLDGMFFEMFQNIDRMIDGLG